MPQRQHFDNPCSSSSSALAALIRLRAAKLLPDPFAVAAAIKESSSSSSSASPCPALAQSLHGFSVKLNLSSTTAVEKSLMHAYSRLGTMADSRRVFDGMARRDPASWNVLLSGYARRPRPQHAEAMRLFRRMHACGDPGVEPNPITLAVVLPACAKTGSPKPGMSVHCYIVKKGFESETLLGNALVSMYAKCGGGGGGDAVAAFRAIGSKDVVSWNSIVAGCSENDLYSEAVGAFYEMASATGLRPNAATFVSVLPVCVLVPDGRRRGKEIHCRALRLALGADVSVCNALVAHYSKAGDVEGAEAVFERMTLRDVVTWNTVISGYAMNGYPERVMGSFRELTSTTTAGGGTRPDSVTLVTVLPVCAELRDLEEGRRIHGYVLRRPILLQESTSLGNALVSFYGKCGEADTAMAVFMGLPKKDLVSWNALLSALADNAQWGRLLELLHRMSLVRVRPDSITIVSVLQACAFFGTRKVREAHGFSLRAGLTVRPAVGNSILDAYAKCGDIESACKHFESLAERNVITGNTMISGCLKHGRLDEAEKIFDEMFERDLTTSNLMLRVRVCGDRVDGAFDLFREMQEGGGGGGGMRPDGVSIMGVLAASGRSASAHLVRQCHGYAIRSSLDDLQLDGALLDAYSKCGSIDDASRMFQASTKKDLVTFTAMVSGYSMHGMAEEAVGVFNQMLRLGTKPDHVVFTSLLSACSHAGLADEARKHFESITEVYGMRPTAEHYACLVDLLARSGRIGEAYGLLDGMPLEANAGMWGSLLGACRTHGEVEIGRVAADRLFEVEDGNVGNYVVMSNIYAADGRWDGVEEVRRLMRSRGGRRKTAGCSWVEVDRSRHVFVAGDLCHPRRWFIYNLLESLNQQLRVTASEELTELMDEI